MNTERDKFLTKVMGECWHKSELFIDDYHDQVDWRCAYCTITNLNNNDFSTWAGFGKLLTWCKEQDDEFLCKNEMCLAYLTPDRFATAVYNYLKEKQQ